MTATLGTTTLLCTCGRRLDIPVEVQFVQASNGQLEGRVQLDNGYLYAHFATWHRPPNSEPRSALDMLNAA